MNNRLRFIRILAKGTIVVDLGGFDMTPPTEFDEDFYEGIEESNPESKLRRYILSYLFIWAVCSMLLFFMVGPPQEHLMLYIITPMVFFICAFVGGSCSIAPS